MTHHPFYVYISLQIVEMKKKLNEEDFNSEFRLSPMTISMD